MRGFAAIGSFAGRSSLSTWLTRIAINEALGRARAAQRRRKRLEAASVLDLKDYRDSLLGGTMHGGQTNADTARGQISTVVVGRAKGPQLGTRNVVLLVGAKG